MFIKRILSLKMSISCFNSILFKNVANCRFITPIFFCQLSRRQSRLIFFYNILFFFSRKFFHFFSPLCNRSKLLLEIIHCHNFLRHILLVISKYPMVNVSILKLNHPRHSTLNLSIIIPLSINGF